MRQGIDYIQHILILLIFTTSVLIFLDLSIFSASFIFGIALLLYSLNKTPGLLLPHGLIWLLFVFLIIALLSMMFADTAITVKKVRIYIQTIYWYLLATVVYNSYEYLDKEKLSKYLFYSVFLLLIIYYMGIRYGMSQNAVAFSAIISGPLGYYYIKKNWLKIVIAILLIYLILLNGSRSGAVICILQSALIILFSLKISKRRVRLILVVFALIALSFNLEPIRILAGGLIMPINKEVGTLLIDYKHVMMHDMSWLQRKAQVQKGKQIFAKHPILGIGYLNFQDYDIKIDESKVKKDRPLRQIDNRSAHNSYVGLLSETGILGFSAFISFFLVILIRFWKNISFLGGTFESGVFVSFIGMLIYFYSISSLAGTSSWIMFGLYAGSSKLINDLSSQGSQEIN